MEGLCTACLCSGRNLRFIGEIGAYNLYSQILNEIPVYDLSQVCIKVCWECCAILRKLQEFKIQVKRSYSQLLQLVSQDNQNADINAISKPPRLQSIQVSSVTFPLELKLEYEELNGGNDLSMEDIKSETEHWEPETFVNDLDVNTDVSSAAKVTTKVKIKDKSKKKLNKEVKVKKSRVKKKVKVKVKKNKVVIDSEPQDDNNSGISDREELDPVKEDKLEDKLLEKKKITKAVSAKEVITKPAKANGVIKTIDKEVLGDKPQCVECGKMFSSRKTYRYHLNVLHKGQNRYPCPRCGKVYQWKSNLGRHMRSHKARDSGELYCETCDKRFASVATYRQHLRVSRRHVSENEFSFKCNECGKKFVNKTRLRDHIDWEHLNNIKFRCQLCNKPFKCHTSLYVHRQNVHKNKEKKDNLCHVCGKSYQNAAKLKYHIVAMHTSETPYQCSQCHAAFGWYSSLYRHVREVHYKMKVQPKKSKKSKRPDALPPILPHQHLLPSLPHIDAQTHLTDLLVVHEDRDRNKIH